MNEVLLMARPIPVELRDQFLQLVAQALSGREFGDGDLHRICADAQRRVLWDTDVRIDVSPDGDSNEVLSPRKNGRPIDLEREEQNRRRREAAERLKQFERMRQAASERLRAMNVK
jgi:hypothetical protein